MAWSIPPAHPAAMPSSEDNQAVGKRLQRLREGHHWSMAELAARCSGAQVTPSQINKLEKGRQQFTVDWLFRLARALGCPVCELVEDRTFGPPPEEQALLGQILELAESDRDLVKNFVGRIAQAPPNPEGHEC
jgi:transcriptional regulator with XRE-family HTH domain